MATEVGMIDPFEPGQVKELEGRQARHERQPQISRSDKLQVEDIQRS